MPLRIKFVYIFAIMHVFCNEKDSYVWFVVFQISDVKVEYCAMQSNAKEDGKDGLVTDSNNGCITTVWAQWDYL